MPPPTQLELEQLVIRVKRHLWFNRVLFVLLFLCVLGTGVWQWFTWRWLRDDLVKGWIQQHGFVYDDPGPPDPTKPPPPPPAF